MKNCQKCGKENSDAAKWCSKCGSPLTFEDYTQSDESEAKRPSDKQCASCGKMNPPNATWCAQCGAPLEQKAPESDAPVFRPMSEEEEEQKKSKVPLIVAIIAAVAIILAVSFVLITASKSRPKKPETDTDSSGVSAVENESSSLKESSPDKSSSKESEVSKGTENESTAEESAVAEHFENKSTSDYYILPESSTRLLTYRDIENFTKQDMMLARNEIFARHGRIFKDEDVKTYFEAQAWYSGTIKPEDFSESVLSSTEKSNIDLIKEYEDGTNGIKSNVGDSGQVVTTYHEYIIPQSSNRLLTYSDISGLSKYQLMLARNEIYARNGRLFSDIDIQTYFDSRSWYLGYIPPNDFTEELLTSIEKKNVAFILSYE